MYLESIKPEEKDMVKPPIGETLQYRDPANEAFQITLYCYRKLTAPEVAEVRAIVNRRLAHTPLEATLELHLEQGDFHLAMASFAHALGR
jgi:hypothetical protein